MLPTKFILTVTVNLSDDTEINDIDVDGAFTAGEIGEAAMKAAEAYNTETGAAITSLVIVAVVV